MFDDEEESSSNEDVSDLLQSTSLYTKSEKEVKNSFGSSSNYIPQEDFKSFNSLFDDESSKDVKILRESIFLQPNIKLSSTVKLNENQILGSHSNYDNHVIIRGGRNEKFPDFDLTINTLKLDEKIVENLKRMKIVDLTKLQKLVISLILNNDQDIVACADTGLGKTISYLIPIINNIEKQKTEITSIERKPKAVILFQKPENAKETYLIADKISEGLNLQLIPVIGSSSSDNTKSKMESFLYEGGDIIIGTISRFSQYICRKKIPLNEVKTVVYDDVDIFLKEKEWEKALSTFRYNLPNGRRTFVFSSFFDDQARLNLYSLVRHYFWFVAIGQLNHVEELIKQNFIIDKPVNHDKILIKLLIDNAKNGKCPKTIIFTNLPDGADWLAGRLRMFKDIPTPFEIRAAALHYAVPAKDRDSIFEDFLLPNNDPAAYDVIVISDKIACGISTPADLIINYEYPLDISTYILRVGRTQQNQHVGEAYTFVDVSQTTYYNFELQHHFYTMLITAKRTNHSKFPDVLENFYQKVISKL